MFPSWSFHVPLPTTPPHPLSHHYPTTNNHYFKVYIHWHIYILILTDFSVFYHCVLIYGKTIFHPYMENMFINPISISLNWPILTFSPLFEKQHISPWFTLMSACVTQLRNLETLRSKLKGIFKSSFKAPFKIEIESKLQTSIFGFILQKRNWKYIPTSKFKVIFTIDC